MPWDPRLRAMGFLHKELCPPWFDFQKRYFSGTTVWKTKVTSFKTSRIVGLVRRAIGSTAMRSLFRTQSSDRSFLSFLRISMLPQSRRVRIKARLLFAPSKLMNQLAELHLRLLPRCSTSGKATIFSPGTPVFLPPQKLTFLNSNSIWCRAPFKLALLNWMLLDKYWTCIYLFILFSSAGKVSSFALELSVNKAFLLHSSQSVTTTITRSLLHFKPSSRQVLQAFKEGMCEEWPFSLQFGHTDL